MYLGKVLRRRLFQEIRNIYSRECLFIYLLTYLSAYICNAYINTIFHFFNFFCILCFAFTSYHPKTAFHVSLLKEWYSLHPSQASWEKKYSRKRKIFFFVSCIKHLSWIWPTEHGEHVSFELHACIETQSDTHREK